MRPLYRNLTDLNALIPAAVIKVIAGLVVMLRPSTMSGAILPEDGPKTITILVAVKTLNVTCAGSALEAALYEIREYKH